VRSSLLKDIVQQVDRPSSTIDVVGTRRRVENFKQALTDFFILMPVWLSLSREELIVLASSETKQKPPHLVGCDAHELGDKVGLYTDKRKRESKRPITVDAGATLKAWSNDCLETVPVTLSHELHEAFWFLSGPRDAGHEQQGFSLYSMKLRVLVR
jgi:hypothetical protein